MSAETGFRKTQVNYYQAFIGVGVGALLLYAVYYAAVERNFFQTALHLGLGAMLALLVLRLKRTSHLRSMLRLCTFMALGFVLYLTMDGGEAGERILWGYVFPLTALFLLGEKEGLAWSAAYLGLAAVLLSQWNTLVHPYPYAPAFKLRFFSSYAVVAVMLTYFVHLREVADRELYKHIDGIEATQQSLRQSEEKFHKVFENSPDSMVIVELETGKMVDVNGAFVRAFGYTREEVIGRTTLEIGLWLHPEQRGNWVDHIRKEGVSLNMETRFVDKNGRIKDVILSTSEFFHQSTDYFVSTAKDVTKIRQAEETIKRRMEELATLNHISGVINATLSLNEVMDTALREVGEVLQPDAAMLFLRDGDNLVMKKHFPEDSPHLPNIEHLHKVGECLCGQAVARNEALYSPDIHTDARCTLTECKEIGLHTAFVAPLNAGQENLGVLFIGFVKERKLDDQTDFLQALANEIALAVNNAILYEQVQSHSQELEVRLVQIKQAEAIVADSTELFRTIFDLIPYPIDISRLSDGKFINVNKAFEKVSGYPRDRIIGSTAVELRIMSKKEYARLYNMLTREKQLSNVEVSMTGRNGRPMHLLFSGVLLEVSGETCSMAGSVDVTQLKLLEKQLVQSQKMEAIGTLAGGIAHDFNNILSIIHGYAELAFNQAPTDSPLKKQLESVLKASDRATDLVRHILAFSRQTEKERKPIEIGPLVKESLKLLRASIPKSIEMQQQITDENLTLRADPTEIHQIVMNLCTNAYQAIGEEGGAITVELKKVALGLNNGLTNLELAPGEYLLLRVSDTGGGIDQKVVDKIFDPYFTTKAVGQGTGLGLSMVRRIVEDYQGRIHVYSEPGQGTTFSLYFPASTAVPEQTDEMVRLPTSGSENILLVDDEEAIVTIITEYLKTLGYHVESHVSSPAALESFKAHPGKFHLVVTDQTMPELTGMKLARELRDIRPDLPIILCTGFSATVTTESIKQAGLHEILMKPVLLGDLAASIRKALDGRGEGPPQSG